ncbi:acyl-CoA thioesterase, partial [Bacillus sp. S2-R3J1-FB-BA1]|uniref:acyl-CoA thioesterase n=1 Tax=Bacillus sp. S2-R3J1-FB-BA1 TaxID=1973490 RepID=UPI002101623C
SRVFKTSRVFPTDLNEHNTLFGGKILAEMDMVASVSAKRHARNECVTASMDWVDFLHPVRSSDWVSYECFVIWTGRTRREVRAGTYRHLTLTTKREGGREEGGRRGTRWGCTCPSIIVVARPPVL